MRHFRMRFSSDSSNLLCPNQQFKVYIAASASHPYPPSIKEQLFDTSSSLRSGLPELQPASRITSSLSHPPPPHPRHSPFSPCPLFPPPLPLYRSPPRSSAHAWRVFLLPS